LLHNLRASASRKSPQQELEALLSKAAEDRPLIHPKLAAIYRQKVADLQDALLQESSRAEEPTKCRLQGVPSRNSGGV
jgi:hypothetical protein